jgi:hypothetical protein
VVIYVLEMIYYITYSFHKFMLCLVSILTLAMVCNVPENDDCDPAVLSASRHVMTRAVQCTNENKNCLSVKREVERRKDIQYK